MGTISKRTLKDSIVWEAQIRRRGYPKLCKSFMAKDDAMRWMRETESSIDKGKYKSGKEAEKTTLLEALDRYLEEVSALKKGWKREKTRIEDWKKRPIASRFLSGIRSSDISAYRKERRAEKYSERTITLELAIISHLYSYAQKKWQGMEALENPVIGSKVKGTDPDRKTKKEKGYRGRDRVLSADEQTKFLPILTKEMRRIVIIAIETGMRRGELMGLAWSQIDLSQRMVKLTDTKNGTSRDVPLTNTAIAAFREQAHGTLPISGKVWSIGADRATSIFAEKAREVELSDIRFHDLRHTAATRLAKVYQINDLAKILGHSTLDMTLRYYNPTGNELVNKMIKAGV